VPGHFRRGDRFLGKAHTLARGIRFNLTPSRELPPPPRSIELRRPPSAPTGRASSRRHGTRPPACGTPRAPRRSRSCTAMTATCFRPQGRDLRTALRIPDAGAVVIGRCHHPLAVAAERRAPYPRRMSLEEAVKPCGQRATCQLAFYFGGEQRGPREATACRIDLQRVAHGTVELLILQRVRGTIALPGYIAEQRQHQHSHTAQQPRDTPLQPSSRLDLRALLSEPRGLSLLAGLNKSALCLGDLWRCRFAGVQTARSPWHCRPA